MILAEVSEAPAEELIGSCAYTVVLRMTMRLAEVLEAPEEALIGSCAWMIAMMVTVMRMRSAAAAEVAEAPYESV